MFTDLPIIEGPVPWVVYAIAVAFVLILVIRKGGWRRLVTSLLGIVIGVLLALVVFVVANATSAFGTELPFEVCVWAMAAAAGIGLAVVNLWDSTVWRKVIAVVAILWFAITGVIGVNAFYGLNPTLGSLFGIVASDPIDIPTARPTGSPAPAGPLYQTWNPPSDMPSKGTQGTQRIPATLSGFQARDAGIYLPPAALVEGAPPLPLVIIMMGYPGNPDPNYVAPTLDDYAAANKGLAPIVIVADQIGTGGDPACADSAAFGNAETYITKDVPAWARANLNIIDDPDFWVIAGYSNGGGCAIKYGASDPGQWKNILDMSGEEFPGSEDVDGVTTQIYRGDSAAFEASKPINIMKAAKPDTYDGVNAIFTVGGADPEFVPGAKAVAAQATASGMNSTYIEIPGAGHLADGLDGGLTQGFGVLYPLLGLAPPR